MSFFESNPVLKAHMNEFKKEFLGNEDLPHGKIFEQFVNYVVLTNQLGTQISPNESEILDSVYPGGHRDMGLDGIIILVNNSVIKSVADIDDLISDKRKLKIDFIFIQSKYKEDFERNDEFLSYIIGIKRFLSQDKSQVSDANNNIKSLIEIKEKLLSEDSMIYWDHNHIPRVKCLYVFLGKEPSRNDVDFAITELEEKVYRSFGNNSKLNFQFLNSDSLLRICLENKNQTSLTLKIFQSANFSPSEGVTNSTISIVNAVDFIDFLKDGETEELRRQLFEDNVRDYQGENLVNSDIYKTLSESPDKFALLNNGVTIVCQSFSPSNNILKLDNPQIVNGCQTSNVLFKAYQDGIALNNIQLVCKIVATNNFEVSNQVVKGSNRQNLVYEEAFETLKPFHKGLEEFFKSMNQQDSNIRIFYERRSKQYANMANIRKDEIITFPVLTQLYVGIFREEPHNAYRAVSTLLSLNKDKIFCEGQEYYQYYFPVYLFRKFNHFFTDEELRTSYKKYKTYKYHLFMILKILLGGSTQTFNDQQKIKDYSLLICNELNRLKKSEVEALFIEATNIFDSALIKWEFKLSKSRDGIKDNKEFTKLLLEEVYNKGQIGLNKSSYLPKEVAEYDYYTSEILFTHIDKNDNPYGFIYYPPNNIYFHSKFSKKLNFNTPNLKGKKVRFRVFTHPSNGQLNAKDVELIN